LDLKSYPSQYSVFAFGDFIHYIDKNTDFNSKDLAGYLTKKEHQEITIQPAITTIEDVFMDL
jgi:ABC-2 type transport system ATP-binding protein